MDILLTGSVLGREPVRPGAAASTATGALTSLVRTAAIEVSPPRVDAISPAALRKSLTP